MNRSRLITTKYYKNMEYLLNSRILVHEISPVGF